MKKQQKPAPWPVAAERALQAAEVRDARRQEVIQSLLAAAHAAKNLIVYLAGKRGNGPDAELDPVYVQLNKAIDKATA